MPQSDYSVKVSSDVSKFNEGMDSAVDSTKKFQKATDDAKKDLDDLGKKGGKAVSELYDEMRKLEKGGRSVSNYRRQLSQLTRDIQDLTINYNNLTKAEQNSQIGTDIILKIQEMTQEAAKYKDQIADAQASIRALASDTAAWDAMKQGIGVVSGALQGIAAAGVLGADSTEKLVSVIAKLKSIEAVTNTVIQIGNALQKQSALMMGVQAVQAKALAKAKILETTATKGATVAQKVFNAVAKANPYVLLASAIIAVGSALAAFAIKSDKAKKAQEELKEAHEKYMDSISDSISKMGDANYQFDTLAKKYKKCRTEAEKQQFLKNYKTNLDNLGISVNSINGLEDVFINRTEDFRRACILRAQAMGLETMQAETYKDMMKELMEAKELAAGQGGKRIDEGNPLFDLLKKYNIGQYVARGLWQKDYINAPADVGKQLDAAIRKQAAKTSKTIEDEQQKLEDQVKALNLGDAFNFDSKGNSGLPETIKKTTGAAKETTKEFTSQIEVAKKLLSTLEEQKKYIQEGTDEWKEQIKRIEVVKAKIKELEDAEKAYIESLKRSPLQALELPKNLPQGKVEYKATLDVKPQITKEDQAELYKQAEETASKIQGWFEIGVISKEDAKNFVKNINDVLAQNGIKAKVKIDVDTAEIKKAVDKIDSISSISNGFVGSFNDIYESISSLTEKLDEASNGWEQFFAVFQTGMSIMSGVANILESVAAVTELVNSAKAAGITTTMADTAATRENAKAHIEAAGAKGAEAAAGAGQSVSSIPYIGPILAVAAIASVLAAIISAIAKAKKFNNGGIFRGGGGVSGDRNLARLNDNEMILNTQQQARLFKLLDGKESLNGGGGQVEFKIRGTELVGVLNNQNKKNSKI